MSTSKNITPTYEIANHAWRFSPLDVARMLPPNTPTPGLEAPGELLRLDKYNCTVNGPAFRNALGDVVTRLNNDLGLTIV